MRIPARSSSWYRERPAHHVVLTSVSLLTVRMRTSTPRDRASLSSFRKSSSGTKYELATYSDLRELAIDSAMNRSAGVLPVVGDEKNSPACKPPSTLVNAFFGKKMSPEISSPVHSAHAAANAAWSPITAGPSKRTFVSRHWSL